jgi:hypothetical protein
MQTAVNGAKKCGKISSNPLAFEEADFIPDKRNDNENYATTKVCTKKGTGQMEMFSGQNRNTREHLLRDSLQQTSFTPMRNQRQGWSQGSTGIILFLSHRSESLDKSRKTNDQSPTTKCTTQIFKNPKDMTFHSAQ